MLKSLHALHILNKEISALSQCSLALDIINLHRSTHAIHSVLHSAPYSTELEHTREVIAAAASCVQF